MRTSAVFSYLEEYAVTTKFTLESPALWRQCSDLRLLWGVQTSGNKVQYWMYSFMVLTANKTSSSALTPTVNVSQRPITSHWIGHQPHTSHICCYNDVCEWPGTSSTRLVCCPSRCTGTMTQDTVIQQCWNEIVFHSVVHFRENILKRGSVWIFVHLSFCWDKNPFKNCIWTLNCFYVEQCSSASLQ